MESLPDSEAPQYARAQYRAPDVALDTDPESITGCFENLLSRHSTAFIVRSAVADQGTSGSFLRTRNKAVLEALPTHVAVLLEYNMALDNDPLNSGWHIDGRILEDPNELQTRELSIHTTLVGTVEVEMAALKPESVGSIVNEDMIRYGEPPEGYMNDTFIHSPITKASLEPGDSVVWITADTVPGVETAHVDTAHNFFGSSSDRISVVLVGKLVPSSMDEPDHSYDEQLSTLRFTYNKRIEKRLKDLGLAARELPLKHVQHES